MSETLAKGYHFFRLQVEVPPDVNLNLLVVQLCVEEVYYAVVDGVPDYTTIKAKAPNSVKIITLDNVIELESKYPGLIQAIQFLQQVAIAEGLKYLQAQIQPPLESPEAVTDPNSLLSSSSPSTTSETVSGEG